MTSEHTKRRIERIQVLKEWLDERVRKVFRDYCDIFGIFHAYGVEQFALEYLPNNDGTYTQFVSIVQDTSCRGCYDSTRHIFPADYLYLDHEDRIALMKKRKQLKDASEKAASNRADKARLEQLRKEMSDLSAKLEDV